MRTPGLLAIQAVLCLGACGGDGGGGAEAPSVDGAMIDADSGVSAPAGDAAVDGAVDAGSASRDAAGDEGDARIAVCMAPPVCDSPPPAVGGVTPWRNSIRAGLTVGQGAPRHRGRDLILRADRPQWALAKLAYGIGDSDLVDEDVEIYLNRDCTTWERLGTATSTAAGDHGDVEGVTDDGGRIFFEIPADRRLEVGWHRIFFVVQGDHSSAEALIAVVEDDATVVVTDVDGTLTESETAAYTTLLNGPSPMAQPSAAEVMGELAARGHTIVYLTARPEWLAARTHEWLRERGFPTGIVHTTLGGTGAVGGAAASFKAAELAALTSHVAGPPVYAFGNRESDAEAYAAAGVAPEHRLLYQFDGDLHGGVAFTDYGDLLPMLRCE